MNDAYCYCRFSPKPDASDVQSLIVQEDRCREYARFAGLNVVGVFADPETSARKVPIGKREQGAQLLALLKPGVHLIAYRLDRLFRSPSDGERWLTRWDKRGVRLHLAAEGGCSITTKTATGRFLARILLAAGALEPEQTSERTRDSMKRQQAAGRMMSEIPPYGFVEGPTRIIDGKTKRTLIEEPAEQVQIARMVAWQNHGVKLAEIARRLTADGVPTKMGTGDWSRHVVRRILKRAQVAA